MLNHNYLICIFVFCECFFVRSKKCVSATKGWRTVFDFASAKLINIKRSTKQINQKCFSMQKLLHDEKQMRIFATVY